MSENITLSNSPEQQPSSDLNDVSTNKSPSPPRSALLPPDLLSNGSESDESSTPLPDLSSNTSHPTVLSTREEEQNADSSSDDCVKSDNDENNNQKGRWTHSSGAAKKAKKPRQNKKRAKNNIETLHRETQRIIRESDARVPEHKPQRYERFSDFIRAIRGEDKSSDSNITPSLPLDNNNNGASSTLPTTTATADAPTILSNKIPIPSTGSSGVNLPTLNLPLHHDDSLIDLGEVEGRPPSPRQQLMQRFRAQLKRGDDSDDLQQQAVVKGDSKSTAYSIVSKVYDKSSNSERLKFETIVHQTTAKPYPDHLWSGPQGRQRWKQHRRELEEQMRQRRLQLHEANVKARAEDPNCKDEEGGGKKLNDLEDEEWSPGSSSSCSSTSSGESSSDDFDEDITEEEDQLNVNRHRRRIGAFADDEASVSSDDPADDDDDCFDEFTGCQDIKSGGSVNDKKSASRYVHDEAIIDEFTDLPSSFSQGFLCGEQGSLGPGDVDLFASTMTTSQSSTLDGRNRSNSSQLNNTPYDLFFSQRPLSQHSQPPAVVTTTSTQQQDSNSTSVTMTSNQLSIAGQDDDTIILNRDIFAEGPCPDLLTRLSAKKRTDSRQNEIDELTVPTSQPWWQPELQQQFNKQASKQSLDCLDPHYVDEDSVPTSSCCSATASQDTVILDAETRAKLMASALGSVSSNRNSNIADSSSSTDHKTPATHGTGTTSNIDLSIEDSQSCSINQSSETTNDVSEAMTSPRPVGVESQDAHLDRSGLFTLVSSDNNSDPVASHLGKCSPQPMTFQSELTLPHSIIGSLSPTLTANTNNSSTTNPPAREIHDYNENAMTGFVNSTDGAFNDSNSQMIYDKVDISDEVSIGQLSFDRPVSSSTQVDEPVKTGVVEVVKQTSPEFAKPKPVRFRRIFLKDDDDQDDSTVPKVSSEPSVIKSTITQSDEPLDDEARSTSTDDEEQENESTSSSDEDQSDEGDNNEDSKSNLDDYDDEEEQLRQAVLAKPTLANVDATSNKKRFRVGDYLDEEAELSGDENERAYYQDNDDEADDSFNNDDDLKDLVATGEEADLPSEGRLRRQVERVHQRLQADQDQREIRFIKEMFLQDGDLFAEDGQVRQRRFRWRGLDSDNPLPVGFHAHDDNEDAYSGDDEPEDHARRLATNLNGPLDAWLASSRQQRQQQVDMDNDSNVVTDKNKPADNNSSEDETGGENEGNDTKDVTSVLALGRKAMRQVQPKSIIIQQQPSRGAGGRSKTGAVFGKSGKSIASSHLLSKFFKPADATVTSKDQPTRSVTNLPPVSRHGSLLTRLNSTSTTPIGHLIPTSAGQLPTVANRRVDIDNEDDDSRSSLDAIQTRPLDHHQLKSKVGLSCFNFAAADSVGGRQAHKPAATKLVPRTKQNKSTVVKDPLPTAKRPRSSVFSAFT